MNSVLAQKIEIIEYDPIGVGRLNSFAIISVVASSTIAWKLSHASSWQTLLSVFIPRCRYGEGRDEDFSISNIGRLCVIYVCDNALTEMSN